MKLVVFNDIHFSARAPASRRANYPQAILNKLREIVDFANGIDADVLACTGDWFISKKPESTPFWLVAQIYDILSDFNGKLITAIGNHDVETSLEFFSHSPLYMLCHSAQMDYDVKSGLVYTDYGQGVEIVTVNYDKGATAEGIRSVIESSFRNPIQRQRPQPPVEQYIHILIVHSPIVQSRFTGTYPEQFMEKAVRAEELIGCADYIFYGDIHDPHGVYGLAGTTFCNMGAISRNSAKELNSHRPVLAAYLDTAIGQIASAELENVEPAEDAFRAEEIRYRKELAGEIENFVDALDPRSLSFTVLTPDILRDRITDSPDLNPREKQIGIKAVEGAS